MCRRSIRACAIYPCGGCYGTVRDSEAVHCAAQCEGGSELCSDGMEWLRCPAAEPYRGAAVVGTMSQLVVSLPVFAHRFVRSSTAVLSTLMATHLGLQACLLACLLAGWLT